jgi:predicted O-linked N-acetylglucosamine transferase (SPINDLY family)
MAGQVGEGEPAATVPALLDAALALQRQGAAGEAQRLYRRVLALDPGRGDGWHLLGLLAMAGGRPQEALAPMLRAVASQPEVSSFPSSLGTLLRTGGAPEAAAACYRRALTLDPACIAALTGLAQATAALDRADQAAAAYARVLVADPGQSVARHNLGLLLMRQGRREQALACLLPLAQARPTDAEVRFLLGTVAAALGRDEDAIVCYRQALVLDPDLLGALINLAGLSHRRGRTDRAEALLRRAAGLDPGRPEAFANLGRILSESGRFAAALPWLRHAAALLPGAAGIHHDLALALRGSGGDPMSACRRALALDPGRVDSRLLAVQAQLPIVAADVAVAEGAVAAHQAAVAALGGMDLRPALSREAGIVLPFFLAYRLGDHRETLSRLGDLASGPTAPALLRRAAASRPRLGVVGAQVRRHPVWDVVLKGLVRHLDDRRFELILYHTGSVADAETAWAAERAACFRAGPRTVEGWAETIAADQPDVLFYPEIGMDPATFALASRRLAPVQAAGWGHPITTGLPTIDLFLSGDLLEGPQAGRHYRERLVRLPGTGACTSADGLARGAVPVDGGGPVRFALCQTPFKFDPRFDPLYAAIAREAGPCQFFLTRDAKYPWASDRVLARLQRAFAALGLDPDHHLVMVPWQPPERFATFLAAMDVYLDCPAFSGFTTAWQAAHAGLPLVTLEGEFLRQRLAGGLLRRIGLLDGIAGDADNYVATAVQWAQDCRNRAMWRDRRALLRTRAARADGDLSVVRGFEQTMLAAVSGTLAVAAVGDSTAGVMV